MLTRRAVLAAPAVLARAAAKREPLHRTVELNVGESADVRLPGGRTARVAVLEVAEKRDSVRSALRQARVRLRVNGADSWIVSGNYRLPVEIGGVQVDCPATRGLETNSSLSLWNLGRDVRLRLWPAGSPWVEPGTFDLPVAIRWFATDTQMTNESTYVNGGDIPALGKIYYHNDCDIGGAEGLEPVAAATDGLVVSARNQVHPDYKDSPARPRPDVLYLLDDRGWYYRYSHHQSIDPGVRLGERVRKGQRLGILGKEGGAGWSHLHFGIQSMQPSGKYGVEDAYPFLWEAYRKKYHPDAVAVARPHHLLKPGEEAELDGSLSWSSTGRIGRYEWTFTDGSRAQGAKVRRRYDTPGTFSEILKITDSAGKTSFDFAVVQVVDMAKVVKGADGKERLDSYPPAIHAVYSPTFDLRPGREIAFRLYTYRTRDAQEAFDFGDGTPKVTVRSTPDKYLLTVGAYAETRHSFSKPGDYIVRAETRNARGERAIAHMWVPVKG